MRTFALAFENSPSAEVQRQFSGTIEKQFFDKKVHKILSVRKIVVTLPSNSRRKAKANIEIFAIKTK